MKDSLWVKYILLYMEYVGQSNCVFTTQTDVNPKNLSAKRSSVSLVFLYDLYPMAWLPYGIILSSFSYVKPLMDKF